MISIPDKTTLIPLSTVQTRCFHRSSMSFWPGMPPCNKILLTFRKNWWPIAKVAWRLEERLSEISQPSAADCQDGSLPSAWRWPPWPTKFLIKTWYVTNQYGQKALATFKDGKWVHPDQWTEDVLVSNNLYSPLAAVPPQGCVTRRTREQFFKESIALSELTARPPRNESTTRYQWPHRKEIRTLLGGRIQRRRWLSLWVPRVFLAWMIRLLPRRSDQDEEPGILQSLS